MGGEIWVPDPDIILGLVGHFLRICLLTFAHILCIIWPLSQRISPLTVEDVSTAVSLFIVCYASGRGTKIPQDERFREPIAPSPGPGTALPGVDLPVSKVFPWQILNRDFQIV